MLGSGPGAPISRSFGCDLRSAAKTIAARSHSLVLPEEAVQSWESASRNGMWPAAMSARDGASNPGSGASTCVRLLGCMPSGPQEGADARAFREHLWRQALRQPTREVNVIGRMEAPGRLHRHAARGRPAGRRLHEEGGDLGGHPRGPPRGPAPQAQPFASYGDGRLPPGDEAAASPAGHGRRRRRAPLPRPRQVARRSPRSPRSLKAPTRQRRAPPRRPPARARPRSSRSAPAATRARARRRAEAGAAPVPAPPAPGARRTRGPGCRRAG